MTLSPEFEEMLVKSGQSGELISTSEFTIDSLKARQKLSENQLPQAGLWLVKLVQAAVALESESASIVFGKRLVEFTCEYGDLPVEPKKIAQHLLGGTLPDDPFLFHFLAGVRGSFYDDTLTSELEFHTPSHSFCIRFHQGGTDIRDEEGEWGRNSCFLVFRTTRPARWPSFNRAATMPLRHLVNRVADEYMAVNNYCWPSSVPLRIDGRELERKYRPSPAIDDESLAVLSQQVAVSSPLLSLPTILVHRRLTAQEGRA